MTDNERKRLTPGEAMAFVRSVALCRESWSERAEAIYQDARADLARMGDRLERADRIETAAHAFLDLALCNAPDVPIPWGDPAATGLVSALRAALEGP